MNEVVKGRMIHLGYGKYIRSDIILALLPITGKKRGPESRTRVLVDHDEVEITASRTEATILRDMTEIDLDSEEARRSFAEAIQKVRDIPSGKRIILSCLRDNAGSIVDAIKASPYKKSQFYRLVKKYDIDTTPYRRSHGVFSK